MTEGPRGLPGLQGSRSMREHRQSQNQMAESQEKLHSIQDLRVSPTKRSKQNKMWKVFLKGVDVMKFRMGGLQGFISSVGGCGDWLEVTVLIPMRQ